jgi:hypothetical protein
MLICPTSLKGERHVDCKSSYKWASPESPVSKAWATWNFYLRKFSAGKSTGSTKLRNPLGGWLQGHPIHQAWYTLIDPATKLLVKKSSGSEIFCLHGRTNNLHIFHSKLETSLDKPSGLIPATMIA